MKRTVRTITAIFLILLMIVPLSGCGEIKKAESAVENMFAAFKALDFEEAEKYVNVDDITLSETKEEESEQGDAMLPEQEMFLKALFGRLDCKILAAEKIDKNTVHVTADVTAVDMKPVLQEFFVNALSYAFQNAFAEPGPSEEERNQKMAELFLESARKTDLSTVTTPTVIKVIKKDKNWKIETDESFVNAVLGGGIEAAKEMEKSFAE